MASAQRVTKTGLQMMIDVIALNQDCQLTFGQTSQLRHLLKEVASQLYYCTGPVHVIQQVPGFSTLQKVCDRLLKAAFIPLPVIGIILGILLLTDAGSAIIPVLMAGILITILVGAMAAMVPILVWESHEFIVTHRALSLRTGFVNNLHRQFEELKVNVLSSVASDQMEAADHADEAMPLLAL